MFVDMAKHCPDFPSTTSVWDYRDALVIPQIREYVGYTREEVGYAGYVDTEDLVASLLLVRTWQKISSSVLTHVLLYQNESFVRTLALEQLNGTIVVSYTVDGVQLNSTSGAILGFLKVLNQVDYLDSPLMQFPVLLSQAKESREYYAKTLPPLLRGLIALSERGVDVLCVRDDCPDHPLPPGGVAVEDMSPRVHHMPLDYCLVCDMACIKCLLDRQSGMTMCGCFLCDTPIGTAASVRNYVRGRDFTDRDFIEMSSCGHWSRSVTSWKRTNQT